MPKVSVICQGINTAVLVGISRTGRLPQVKAASLIIVFDHSATRPNHYKKITLVMQETSSLKTPCLYNVAGFSIRDDSAMYYRASRGETGHDVKNTSMRSHFALWNDLI